LVYRSPAGGCNEGGACAHPLRDGFVKAGLIIATVLVVAALGLDLIAHFFLTQ
jgi:mercuric ion transport protein